VTKLTRRHVYEHPDMTGRPPATVVFCNGAGVDSMALLHLWCHNPKSRDFDLDEVLVITAITGDEYRSTIDAANIGNPGYQNLRSSPNWSVWSCCWSMRLERGECVNGRWRPRVGAPFDLPQHC
jgi:hypothetical protein